MPTITFYRQARQDGGVRTGIEIDREVVFGRLESGRDAPNPLLTWYVIVECEGESLPGQSEDARQWLLANTAVIRHGLESIAEKIEPGLDLDPGPQQQEIAGAPHGVKMTVIYTAIRRFEAQRMAGVLRDIAAHWEDCIRILPEIQPASTKKGEGIFY
jgi:hypothetical protein